MICIIVWRGVSDIFFICVFRLKQHNRLSSGFVFPGQLLKIPPPEPDKPPEPSNKQNKRPSGGRKSSAPVPDEPEIFDAQFVKINVRFITEGKGIVSGSLLLTAKNVRKFTIDCVFSRVSKY